MKNILTLVCFVFFGMALQAQSGQSVFLSKIEVNWLDEEIGDLHSAYQKVKVAVKQKDNIGVAEQKTEVIKSVTSIVSNTRIYHDKMMMDINRENTRHAQVSDNPDDYYLNKRRENPKTQELVLNQNQLDKFNANVEAMETIKANLKATSYAMHASSQYTQKNLEQIESFITLAKNNNRIIQNNLVTE